MLRKICPNQIPTEPQNTLIREIMQSFIPGLMENKMKHIRSGENLTLPER